ncbi:accessory gene regulator ArgB-like protein [Paenibacillus sp. UASWS1643]|uniref:accessory gene regulator ArgB-like protein n=1 Tax=Paenibacillus sp. UASWS1643 TaxID=2580422 RepID=UPI0012391AD8|nr:accessory gene regulator B family protein [Paenibacillus sp. UASWS1643]KAA8750076.1 accessory regulator AgrB [Paenibacillus sp. UASWS1643]
MIEVVAGRMARHIKSVVPNHPVPEDSMRHSLIIILNFVSVVVLTVLAGLATGRLNEAVMLLKCFAFLRLFSGGVHLQTSMGCAIITAGAATALSMFSIGSEWTVILTVISMFIMLFYAPTGIENQTRIPERFYPALKIVSFLIVASNLWFGSSMAAIAFFVQALTLVANEHFMKGGDKHV